jgi:putative salt-induced outer membrane protein YdiY
MTQFFFVRARWLVFSILFAFLMPGAALADVVYLKNGDRISGKVQRMGDEKLEIETPYADTVKIDRAEIISIETDEAVDVMVKGGSVSKARLERVPDGGVTLQGSGDASAAAIPIDKLAYINPSAKESGIGVDWSGRATLGVTDTTGNTQTRDAYVSASLVARAKAWRWTSNGRAKYSEDSGQQTAGSWLVGTRYDWLFRERQYLYARATAQRDTFSGIELRWTAGAGYGYKVLESDRTNLELRAGLDHVSTENTVPPDQSYLAFGWGITFDYWIIPDKLQFFHNDECFSAISSSAGVVVRAETGLRAPIVDDLTANFQVNLDYNSDPAPGFKSTDRTWIVGLGYAF